MSSSWSVAVYDWCNSWVSCGEIKQNKTILQNPNLTVIHITLVLLDDVLSIQILPKPHLAPSSAAVLEKNDLDQIIDLEQWSR